MNSSPRCYTVNDRPVIIAATADGGADCLVLDMRTGSFVIDRSYFARTLPGDHGDVDALSAAEMSAYVSRLRAEILLQMTERFGEASPDGEAELLTALCLAPGEAPFDADSVEILDGRSVRIIGPRLSTRQDLAAVFGPPSASEQCNTVGAVTYVLTDRSSAGVESTNVSVTIAFGTGDESVAAWALISHGDGRSPAAW